MSQDEQTMMSPQLSVAIQEFISICDSSRVSQSFDYGSALYKDSIRHYLASSSEVAQLAVQPGSAKDLAKMMKVLKRRRVPFAVKGGGHGMAPTFSSTTGIQISMARFSKVRYNPKTKLVDVGAGCLWDQVYSKLAPYGRNVIGGAAADGVGVGGWLLGGGYSLKSNRYGLGIDNIVEFEIVTPDGVVRKVNANTEPNLFQALRGGGNNFGIVTRFLLKTYDQGPTYGSRLLFPGSRAEEVKAAILDFVDNEKRQEAVIVAAFRHVLVGGKVEYNISVFCVFDGEKPKRARDVPFEMFRKLAKSGEAWAADPAGWKLGQTEVISNSSFKCISRRPQSPSRPKNSRPSMPKPPASRRKFAAYKEDSEDSDELEALAHAYDDDEYGDDDDDVSTNDGFERMSSHRLFGVTSRRLPSRTSSAASSFDDDGESDDDKTFVGSDDDEDFEQRSRSSKSSKSWKPREDFETYGIPQRVMVTKPVDSMGELNVRGRFGCLMISKYTQPLLDKMAEEAEKSARFLESHRGRSVIVDAWPVHPSIFTNSPPGAAFPHKPGEPYGPMLAYFQWESADDDDFWITKLKGTLNRIRVVARKHGLTPRKPALYNNLSLETVPVHKIYRENMQWLSEVKAQYDPTDVMSLAGGHKIPLPSGPRGKGRRKAREDSEDSD